MRYASSPDAGQIYGTAKLRLRSLDQAPDSLVLDAKELDIYNIQVGLLDSLKQPAQYSDSLQGLLVVYLDSIDVSQGPFEVQVTYLARPKSGLFFTGKSSKKQGVQVWTDATTKSTNSWLPLIHNPADLLTSEIIATVTPEISVLSNGRMTEQLTTEDGKTLYHYVQDQPHSPTDIGLFAGQFNIDTTVVSLSNGYSFPVEFWHSTENTDDSNASFAEINQILSFYSEYLDYIYPWPSLSVLIMDDQYIQDMSLTGLTVFNDDIIKDSKALQDFPESLRLARLLARQWFSHLISVDFHADSWLTESLASYMSLIYIKNTYGESTFRVHLQHLASEYLAEASKYQRPLVWNQWSHPDQLNDNHNAAKGVWVLHTIHEKLGDEAFQELLQYVTQSLAFKASNTDQFLSVLNQFTGDDFSSFFDNWIYSAGHPELEIDYQYDHVSESLYVAIDQVQDGYLVPPSYPLDLTIETYSLAGSELHQISVTSEDQLVSLPLTMKPRYVLPGSNHPYLLTQTVKQEASAWITQLRYASHPISQLNALEALETYTEDPALLIGLQSALRSKPGQEVRAGIVKLISQLPPTEAAQKTLIEAFEDESPIVQQAVLSALAEYEDTSELTIMAMDAAQSSESYIVQAEAVKTLAKIKGPDAYSIIQSALITSSHRDIIRQAALESLFFLDISTRDRVAIAREYSSSGQSTETRLAAIGVLKVLASYDNRQSKNLLVELLNDSEFAIREAVLEALLEVGSEDDVEVLTQFEENENDIRLRIKSRDILTQLRSESEESTSS